MTKPNDQTQSPFDRSIQYGKFLKDFLSKAFHGQHVEPLWFCITGRMYFAPERTPDGRPTARAVAPFRVYADPIGGQFVSVMCYIPSVIFAEFIATDHSDTDLLAATTIEIETPLRFDSSGPRIAALIKG
jgi:hypothetical protein